MISVLIPTKNEPTINELISKLHKALSKAEHEIIVIDKSDVLPEIVGAKLVRQRSDGLGRAILEGLEVAKGKIIVTMDGDFSHDPKDLRKLLRKTEKYDIVIGSRFIRGGKTEDIRHRKFISEMYKRLVRLFLKINLNDPLSGFSVIRRNVYDRLSLKPIGYKIIMEILYKSKRLGFKSIEVPITFRRRKSGKSKVGMMEGLRILLYIFKLKFLNG